MQKDLLKAVCASDENIRHRVISFQPVTRADNLSDTVWAVGANIKTKYQPAKAKQTREASFCGRLKTIMQTDQTATKTNRAISSFLPFSNFCFGSDMDVDIQLDLFHLFSLRTNARDGASKRQIIKKFSSEGGQSVCNLSWPQQFQVHWSLKLEFVITVCVFFKLSDFRESCEKAQDNHILAWQYFKPTTRDELKKKKK